MRLDRSIKKLCSCRFLTVFATNNPPAWQARLPSYTTHYLSDFLTFSHVLHYPLSSPSYSSSILLVGSVWLPTLVLLLLLFDSPGDAVRIAGGKLAGPQHSEIYPYRLRRWILGDCSPIA